MKSIPFGRPIIGDEEKKAVIEVLGGHILTHGPKVKEFETAFSKFVGGGNALAVSSCTAGLHLAYFYLKIGPGDEVIVPAQTHTATAHAVEMCGATPIFIDAEEETGNINIDLIENRINDRTKAISVVHFLGMPVDMKRICDLANKHGLFVVEDCALAMGTYFDGIHAGLHGDVGCFSFYPVKHMTTAEGGMFVTKHDKVAEKVNKQRAFGIDRQISKRIVPGLYNIEMLGFNYRMSEIQAAMGVEQLKKMDFFLKKREENYRLFSEGLKNIEEIELLKSSHGTYKSSYYCLSIILKDDIASKRFEIIKELNEKGVGTSIYYPKPVPEMTYYMDKYGFKNDSFPIASRISDCSIALPVGPHLKEGDVEYMISVITSTIKMINVA